MLSELSVPRHEKFGVDGRVIAVFAPCPSDGAAASVSRRNRGVMKSGVNLVVYRLTRRLLARSLRANGLTQRDSITLLILPL